MQTAGHAYAVISRDSGQLRDVYYYDEKLSAERVVELFEERCGVNCEREYCAGSDDDGDNFEVVEIPSSCSEESWGADDASEIREIGESVGYVVASGEDEGDSNSWRMAMWTHHDKDEDEAA